MKIYNTTTGEVTDLTIIDRKTGCEWTNDLLGNTGSLHYNPEREMAELDQASIEWWQEIIAGLKHIDDLTDEAKYLLSEDDFDDLKERLYENGDGNDYERHIYVLTHILEEVISKHKSNQLKTKGMRTFRVYYTGNSTRFRDFEEEVTANSEREAVEKVYAKFLDQSYFPQEDGVILDCDGEIIAKPSDNTIEYDGGVFMAEEI